MPRRPTATFTAAQHPTVLPGLGKVTAVLGEGGVAWVYEVYNSRLCVHRAVKIIKVGASMEVRERFAHEMQIVPTLRHPNVVTVFSTGESEGRPYIEMERFRGVSLETLLTECGALPYRVVVAIALLVSEALHFAHTHEFTINGETCKGILHRDLKPANILVSEKGVVKLTDFGAARATRHAMTPDEGALFGSLQYVSPEDIRGEPLTARSDLYSLGAVLHESLTGERAFPQTTPQELIKARLSNSCPLLADESALGPRDFRVVIDRCTRFVPDARFDSTATLSAVLLEVAEKHLSETPERTILAFLDDLGKPRHRGPAERITGAFTWLKEKVK